MKRRKSKRDIAMAVFLNGGTLDDAVKESGLTHSAVASVQREWYTNKQYEIRERKNKKSCKQRFFGSGVMFCAHTSTATIWRCS